MSGIEYAAHKAVEQWQNNPWMVFEIYCDILFGDSLTRLAIISALIKMRYGE